MGLVNNSEKKILYISSVLPGTTSGGRLAMYRHLIKKNNFTVAVASATKGESFVDAHLEIRSHRVVARLKRTRFTRWIVNIEYLLNWIFLPRELVRFAEEYMPDLVVCVVDDWHMGLAWQITRRLKLPLVVNFQDLFCLSQFVSKSTRPFSCLIPFLKGRYQMLAQKATQAFYTSEGMRNWFGRDFQGDILYPVGDFLEPCSNDSEHIKINSTVRVVYAGNCYGAYGRMLLSLAKAVKNRNDISLQIFAAGNDWPAEVVREMQKAGIYKGFKPFEQLKLDFQNADAFLTVMSFEKAEMHFMKTSFTTKWLDYVPYGKPVFVWAPDYSTACQFARQHEAGITVVEDSPQQLIDAVAGLAGDIGRWQKASEGAKYVAENVLNAENIHGLFVDRILHVCQQPT